MSDFISKQAVIELIESKCTDGCMGNENLTLIDAAELLDDVESMPIAYDVDKVVGQLEDRSTLSRPVGWPKSYEIITLDNAIEIVKGGGVNE